MKVIKCLFVISLFSIQTIYAAGGGTKNSKYMKLEPPFIVNIQTEKLKKTRYLQVSTELELTDPKYTPDVQHHSPAIRHDLIMLLSKQTVSSVGTLEGKENLRKKALKTIQKTLKKLSGKTKYVDQVYFTKFIIQ